MNEPMQKNTDNADVKYPSLTIFSHNEAAIPLEEYANMAWGLAKECNISLYFHENKDEYRFDFNLHSSVIQGSQTSVWCRLIEESDMYIMSVPEGIPQIIRASFYRTKQKNDSSK